MRIFENYSLKAYNTFRIDCKAAFFTVVTSVLELRKILAEPKFLKLLNSLQVSDYQNLSLLIINYDGIPILEKQKFIDVIQKYKNLLIQKYNQGLTEFNGKSIKNIINFL